MERTIPDATPWPVAFVAACALGAVAFPLDADVGVTTTAALLIVGSGPRQNGFRTLVGWLIGGALVGAAGGYALGTFATLPLSTQGVVGLGIALGGGFGAVTNLMATADEDPDSDPDAVTVDMDADEPPTPRPADLFDGHPDPILYVADEGHGPVVLAANQAYAETFGVAAETISGTPLDEALFVTGDPADVVEAVTSDDALDDVFECETPEGVAAFRLRTTGGEGEGYVLYTTEESTA